MPRGKRKCPKNKRLIDWRGRRSKIDEQLRQERLQCIADKLSERFPTLAGDELFHDLSGLCEKGTHVDLLMVCAFDLLWRNLGFQRQRNPSRQQIEQFLWPTGGVEDDMVKRLKRCQPDYSKSHARAIVDYCRRVGDWKIYGALARKRRPEDALDYAAPDGNADDAEKPRVLSSEENNATKPAVSKAFYWIDRKMAYYWRNHKKYRRAKTSMEAFVRKQLSSGRPQSF